MISKSAEVRWAQHPTELNVVEFFLWGYAKSEVDEESPQDILGLKDYIGSCFGSISLEMLCVRAIANFRLWRWSASVAEVAILNILSKRSVGVEGKVFVTDAIHGSKLQIWLFNMVLGNGM